MNNMEQEMGYLKGKIENLEEKVTKVEAHQEKIEQKQDDMNTKIDQIIVNQSTTKNILSLVKAGGMGLAFYAMMQLDNLIRFFKGLFS